MLGKQGTATILVVDDEELIVDFLTMTLKFGRHKVLSAGSALEAVALCRSHAGPIDLAFLDISLHGTSGPELGRSLREIILDLPIIYMTGFAGEVMERFGVDPKSCLLLKPFTARQVSEKVREVLSAT